MRKFYIVILTVLLMLTAATYAQATPTVIVNGSSLAFDVSPTIENGRTLVPLRTIFEALGATVQWDDKTNTVTAAKSGTEIKLTIGGQASKNGQTVNLDVPAKVIDGRTMVPLRFVGEAMGCQVSWDGDTQTISIVSNIAGTGGNNIEVHYINVGQADAIYISLADHNDILIDAGNVADGLTVVNYLTSRKVDDIELLIATHPHEDHIGGLPAVLDAFRVEKILDSGKTADSGIYKEYAAKAKAEGAEWIQDNRQTYTFGNTVLQVFTGPETWQDTNDYSVVCRLDTGDIEFLFTGDAEGPAEAALAGDLSVEILKVGHHGSRTSSSAAFLSKIKPEVAVISVGTGNKYGHPAPETLQRLKDAGITIYRTDINRTLIIMTDGKTYSVAGERRGPFERPEPQIPPQIQPQVQPAPEPVQTPATEGKYVGSLKSNKYHNPNCRYATSIAPENVVWFKDKAAAQAAGYEACKVCNP